MAEQRQKPYNETDNKHPRGFIGMDLANQLICYGWHEETRGFDDHFWIAPDGTEVGSLEFAFERAFGRKL